MDIQHAAIIGKGAVGLLYGSLIAQNIGPDAVEYVMDDARFERHRNETALVNGEPCTIRTIAAHDAEPADLVILTVKAPGLAEALDTMQPLVGPNTCIISLLNGITSEERIAGRFGWAHTVLAVAQGMDAVFLNGALTFSHPGEIRFGAAPQTEPGVTEAIDAFFARAGIAHVVEADIRHRQWAKLLMNVGINQTCMVFGSTYGDSLVPGEQNRCMVAAMREVIAVARAEGIELTEDDLNEAVALIGSVDPAGMPSMAQDRINRRPTEVEEFAGTIRRLARKHGLVVPTNDWLYQQIRSIEASWVTE